MASGRNNDRREDSGASAAPERPAQVAAVSACGILARSDSPYWMWTRWLGGEADALVSPRCVAAVPAPRGAS